MAGAPPCRATHARPCRWGGQTAPECRGRRLAEQRMRDHVAGGADGAGMSGAPPLRSRVWPCRARSSLAPACRVAPQRQSFRIPEAPPLGGAGRAAGTARPANAFPAAHPAGESGGGRGPRRRHPAGYSRAAGRKARRGKEIGFGAEDPSAPDALKSQPPPGRYAGAPLRAALFPPGQGAGRKDRMSCRSPPARGPFPSPFHRAALNRSEPRPGAAARGPFPSPFHSSTPEPGQEPPLGLRLERGHDFAKHVAALPEKRRGVLV